VRAGIEMLALIVRLRLLGRGAASARGRSGDEPPAAPVPLPAARDVEGATGTFE
jgi:hypothetical protein